MSEATELQIDAAGIVREFFELLELGDVDGALALADNDIVWRNTTLPTVRGVRRVGKLMRMMDRYHINFAADIPHIAADGNVVLTERTDYLGRGGFKVGFWVCGTFEVRDGKITLWHDHFSWLDVLRGTAVGTVQSLRSRKAPSGGA